MIQKTIDVATGPGDSIAVAPVKGRIERSDHPLFIRQPQGGPTRTTAETSPGYLNIHQTAHQMPMPITNP